MRHSSEWGLMGPIKKRQKYRCKYAVATIGKSIQRDKYTVPELAENRRFLKCQRARIVRRKHETEVTPTETPLHQRVNNRELPRTISTTGCIGEALTMRLSDAGLHQRQTKALYPNHRLPPWLTEDATRDRSNRLLGVEPSCDRRPNADSARLRARMLTSPRIERTHARDLGTMQNPLSPLVIRAETLSGLDPATPRRRLRPSRHSTPSVRRTSDCLLARSIL